MSTNLKDELFALPVEERIQLVEELWDSVAPERAQLRLVESLSVIVRAR